MAYPHALSVLLPVALHFPRFTPARYRIVVMLAYFSTPDGWTKWVDSGKRCGREKACLTSWKDTRQRVAHQLFPDAKDHSHRRAIECGTKREPFGRIAFRTAAERHLADLTKYTRLPRALRWALVPSERCYWIDILRTPRRLRQQRSAYLIGRRVLALIPGEPGQAINQRRLADHARKVDAIASKPHCGRQALYNARRFHARCFELLGSCGDTLVERELEASAAYRLLYESIYESEGAAWAATWFDSDPDLEPLRGLRPKDRRWDHLLQELGTDTDQPGTART